jgi:hypothetical protein
MAFESEMRSLEHRIANGSGSRSSFIIAALKELPPGIINITEDRCEFVPHAAQPTRAKTARVSHLQRRARFALALSGADELVTRAQPVAEQHEASEYVYIPADFNPPH